MNDLYSIFGAIILDALRLTASIAVAIAVFDGLIAFLAATALWVGGNYIAMSVVPEHYARAAELTGSGLRAATHAVSGLFNRFAR